MPSLEARIAALEGCQGCGGASARLVLLAPRGELTAEQQAQAAAARAAGRPVFLIVLVARDVRA